MDINTYIAEFAKLMSEGDFDMAVRLSGEVLAEADARWTALVNDSKDASRELDEGNFAGARHVESLIAVGQLREAFSTAIMLLIKSALSRGSSVMLEKSRLDLLNLSFEAFHRFLMENPALRSDSDAVSHVTEIMSQLGSMLYDSYSKLVGEAPDYEVLSMVYPRLKELREIGAIQYPAIMVAGRSVNLDRPMEILSDTAGRARAIGLFACD